MTGIHLPVVFACDDRFAPHCAVAIASMLLNAAANSACHVRILHAGLRDENIQRLSHLQALHPRAVIETVRIRDVFRNAPAHPTLPVATYYRLLAHTVVPDDKFLYLDSDVIVTKDLQPLFATELGDCYCAATLTPGARDGRIVHDPRTGREEEFLEYLEQLGLPRDIAPDYYVNCGTLLLNARQLRHDRLDECFSRTIASSDYFHAADQDVFNACTGARKVILDLTWNFQTSLPRVRRHHTVRAWLEQHPEYRAQLDRYSRETPAIVHFVRHHPWEVSSPATAYDDLYWRYLESTPWRSLRRRRLAVRVLRPWFALDRLVRNFVTRVIRHVRRRLR